MNHHCQHEGYLHYVTHLIQIPVPLATAKLTSCFFPCWGGWVSCVSPAPRMRRDLGVVATMSHLQKAHWEPSSSMRTRLTYSARDEGPSASQACQPFHRGGRDSAFSSAAGPAKGRCVCWGGEGGALRGSPAVLSRPLVSYLGVGCSVGSSPVQAPGSPFSWNDSGSLKGHLP